MQIYFALAVRDHANKPITSISPYLQIDCNLVETYDYQDRLIDEILLFPVPLGLLELVITYIGDCTRDPPLVVGIYRLAREFLTTPLEY